MAQPSATPKIAATIQSVNMSVQSLSIVFNRFSVAVSAQLLAREYKPFRQGKARID
jgi:hypothetical protein